MHDLKIHFLKSRNQIPIEHQLVQSEQWCGTRTTFEICSSLNNKSTTRTTKTPEQCCSGGFIVNFD